MANSFFFYDLETSGFSPRTARIMQFAGQRTNEMLEPIGDPLNCYIKLTPDIVPDPDAVLVTGITPQTTLAEGVTEAEFLEIFFEQAVQPQTTFVGFNNARFDDEFIQFLNYRNFYDAFEWRWSDGCSRWDILDLVRMTRALRPEAIEWPFTPEGKPTNRLELLTKANKLGHDKAHDALSDVYATIKVAEMLRKKQPKLFNYLYDMRDKNKVETMVVSGEPFVYTSGRYSSGNLHTTVAVMLAKHPQSGAALVYDLRHDPKQFFDMNAAELAKAWRYTRDPDVLRLPVKTLKYNRCPAIAPLGVVKDSAAQARIGLNLETVGENLKSLRAHQAELAAKITQTVKQLDEARTDTIGPVKGQLTVDERLYDEFLKTSDRKILPAVRKSKPEQLDELSGKFTDQRLKDLLPLYKARNHPSALTPDELQAWEVFRQHKLLDGGDSSRLAQYFNRLSELASSDLDQDKRYLIEELQLYGQSILPVDAAD